MMFSPVSFILFSFVYILSDFVLFEGVVYAVEPRNFSTTSFERMFMLS